MHPPVPRAGRRYSSCRVGHWFDVAGTRIYRRPGGEDRIGRGRPVTMSALPDDATDPTAEALRTARRSVDDATRQLDDLTTRLAERQAAVDHLESVLDAVLAASATPIVVIDPGRRVTALSQAAAVRSGASVGSALAGVVPQGAARRVGELIDAGKPVEVDLQGAGDGARVRILPTGHAVVVLSRP